MQALIDFLMNNTIILDTQQSSTNHMGLWAIEPQLFNCLYSMYQSGNLPPVTMVEMQSKQEKAKEYEVYENIAVIRINGVMMKSVPKAIQGTSTIYTKNLLRQASRDEEVKAIMTNGVSSRI